MDLFYILVNIQDFSENATIYAEQPWCLESNAKVLTELEAGLLKNDKLEYFLEVFIVLEILEEIQTSNLCIQNQCLRIIEYAIHDA